MAVGFSSLKDQEAHAAESFAAGKFLVTERLCRTREGELVSEDRCTDGGNLLYVPGMEIPLAEARAAGLIPEIDVAAAADEPEIEATPENLAQGTSAPPAKLKQKGK